MKRKSLFCFFLTAVACLLLIFSCNKATGKPEEGGKDGGKPVVSVALWAARLLEGYAPWLQEQFPDVEFDFYIANNSLDYYKYRAEHGDLPDILTVRRFALVDAVPLKDKLLDFSDTELAPTFYQSYLRNYTYEDGTVNWLPISTEIEAILVNKTLFDKYGIPLPTDYESFIYACKEFEKVGIRGFDTDFVQDYTCMGTLQGFSIPSMMSAEGRGWRRRYESGLTPGLDKDVWLPAFEKVEDLFKNIGTNGDNLKMTSNDLRWAFDRGEIAMIRAESAEYSAWGNHFEKLMMPYPSDGGDNWLFTNPSFQVAASASASSSPEREELILSIITKMLSKEGVMRLSNNGSTFAYKKDVSTTFSPEFANLQPYVDNNKIYIRLSSADMFSVSKDVVQRMVKGEIKSAEEAYEEFDRQLVDKEVKKAPVAVHIDKSYTRKFENGVGNEAASAMYNTLRETLGVDCVIGQSAIVSGEVFSGDYTASEIPFTVSWMSGPLVRMDLTADRLKDLVNYTLSVKGSRDSCANDSTLMAASGFFMELKDNGNWDYTVERLTQDGKELSPDKTYSVVLCVTYLPNLTKLEEAGFKDYTILDGTMKKILMDWILSGKQFSDPTPYIRIV